jgi:cysteine desulfurase
VIYFDHSATSPMSRSTIEAMWPYMTEAFGNASSQHEAGKRAADGLYAARSVVAETFGVPPECVVFTSGGTESDNVAIKGVALANPRGRHIVTSAIEHEAVANSCEYLARFHDFEITVLGVDHEGFVDPDELRRALRADTTLCTIQYANSEVGTIQPIADLAGACAAASVPFHVDAVQAIGLLSIDMASLPVDLLSLAAHKFGGPKGVGALVTKPGVFLEPLIHGGGQEFGLRSGTSNVAGAVGMAAALHTAHSNRTDTTQRLTILRDRLIEGVTNARPEARLTGSASQRLAHHASFCFLGTSGESILLDLEAAGFACSSGSACAAGSQEPSSVLLAMGYPPEMAETAVRFTLGEQNTLDEVEALIAWFAANN